MLDKHRVIDEIFPLQSCKIKGDDPIIYVTFKKNWTTLDYILGDQKEKAIKAKQKEDEEKNKLIENIREQKDKAKKEKDEEMQQFTEQALAKMRFEKNVFSFINTSMFLIYAVMHVMLSYGQYDVVNMNNFNLAVTQSLLPQIDTDKNLAPKQFISKKELNEYFLYNVDYLFKDASDQIENKAYFHKFNFIIPFFKLTNIQAKEIECGSDVSNWIGKNRAAEAGEEYSTKYGYPFNETCYASYISKKIDESPLKNGSYGNLTFHPAERSVSEANGMLNNYPGFGHTNYVAIDYKNNTHFFRDMY